MTSDLYFKVDISIDIQICSSAAMMKISAYIFEISQPSSCIILHLSLLESLQLKIPNYENTSVLCRQYTNSFNYNNIIARTVRDREGKVNTLVTTSTHQDGFEQ